MKRIKLALFSLVVLTGTAVFAQKEQTLTKQTLTKEQRMDKLAQELDLTNKQVKRIEKINKNYTLEIDKVKNDENLTLEAKREAMRTLRQDKKDKVSEVLTEEQNQKLKELNQNAKLRQSGERKVEKHSIQKKLHKKESLNKVQKLEPAEK